MNFINTKNKILILGIFVLFMSFVNSFANSFEYQITGPKIISDLKKINYRVILFNNDSKLLPVKIFYKDKLLDSKNIKDNQVFNIDLSSFKINENESIKLNFKIGQYDNEFSIQYVPDIKALIFTDKPLYQPGQKVYIKGVLLKNDKPSEEKIEIVIQDPKSNKIFYKSLIPKNGVFLENFSISDLVINGVYTVMLQKQSKILATNTFEIKKYTLPKFKIDLDFDNENEFFQVGKNYKAKINCSYFFGKKVSNANVKIDVFTFDIGFNKAYTIEGKTDKNGDYNFELKIPNYIAGIEENKGKIKIDIEVEDTAGQLEKKTQIFDVYQKIINAHLVPSNKPIVGMNNKFYLVVSYANGKEGNFTVNLIKPFKKKYKTNGILEIDYKISSSYEKFVFEVVDDKSNKEIFEKEFYSFSGFDYVFIFRDKAIYKVGQELNFKLYSNVSKTIYLDFFVKSENSCRTVFNDSVKLEAFKLRDYSLMLNPNFSGFLTVRAYFINNDGTISENYKTFIIQDSQELDISVSKNKDVYKVRDKLELQINTSQEASIFVDIVDEALLYLAQSNPELLKIYLQLERELLEPKYEIHSIKDVIIQKKDFLAKVILDKIDSENIQNIFTNNYINNFNSVSIKVNRTIKKMESLYERCYNYYKLNGKLPDNLKELGFRKEDYTDEWGTPFKIEIKYRYINIISAGLDRKFGTEDDISYHPFDIGILRTTRDFITEDLPRKTLTMKTLTNESLKDEVLKKDGGTKEDFLVRQYFPETFFSGLIKCDRSYKLNLILPDSITTWKAQFFGISKEGKLGSKIVDIRVFQDFFIDIDSPVFLTQNDQISLPIVVYNYTSKKLNVNIEIKKEEWFELLDNNVKKLSIDPNSVKSVSFSIRAKKIGINDLTVYGYSANFKDAVKRKIEVIPDGFISVNNKSVYTEKQYTMDLLIPNESIDGSHKVYLYVYPNFSSQLLTGLDKLLAMPYGCFEQTSSVNYPNILILDYLTRKGISNPSLQMKAEYYINIGYQRLLTFEVEGGGFSWFGDKPANKVLTAFGLMQFKDMKKVFFVDENLINRTKKFLLDNQNEDGTWDPDQNYLHQESWSKIQQQKLTITSYILMALLDNDSTIYHQYTNNIKKSLDFIYNNLNSSLDNYTLSLMLNVFACVNKDYEKANKAIEIIIKELEKRANFKGEGMYWQSPKTLFYAQDNSSNIEVTALIGYALIKLKKMDWAFKIIKFLIDSKDNNGIWYSTQPTILALKTITAFDSSNLSQPNEIKININKNELKINFNQDDLAYKIIDVTSYVNKGINSLKIYPKNPVLIDVNYVFYLPFSNYTKQEIISIDVNYDRSELNVNDKVKVNVDLKNNTNNTLEMIVVDLGIPPGFNVDITKLQNNPKIKNVETTNRQIIIYLEKLNPKEKIFMEYELISKYPLKVKVPSSKVYEYYKPNNSTLIEGKVLLVK